MRSYGAVSVSITLFNKAVFSYYHFPYPNLVTTLQISVSLVYMGILARFRVMRFDKLSWEMAKQACSSSSSCACCLSCTSRY